MDISHIRKIGGKGLYEMLCAGCAALTEKREEINNLNVFPVPDGDTGTNMVKTLAGGTGATSAETESISEMMRKFSKGCLLSARGNSGVILSQFIRGLSEGCEEKNTLDTRDFANAFSCGVSRAYTAVIKPVEGTMLTVLREASDTLQGNCPEEFGELLGTITAQMRRSLEKTPDLLPVLREAGVIDSGGAGVLAVFEGMEAYLFGKKIEFNISGSLEPSAQSFTAFNENSELTYGYCTEFILQLLNSKTDISAFSTDSLTEYLESIGNSTVVVRDDSLVKVHVHTFEPEKVLGFARQFGEFVNIKIENMSIQHSEYVAQKGKEHVRYAVAAVVSGDGLCEYFGSIGAKIIIDGGQTNNPSANDFINAFESVDAEHIIVLPNNSNIILTAEQAAKMYDKADVVVLPTKSIAEGYSALSMVNLAKDSIDEIAEDMTLGFRNVSSCSVTTATRDTVQNGITIEKGAFIGIGDGKILSSGKDLVQTAVQMLKNLPDIDDKESVTVFYGKDTTKEDAIRLCDIIRDEFMYFDAVCIYGGQDVYNFIMVVE